MALDAGRKGRLLLIGGAEDPVASDRRILSHLVRLAGAKDARVLICAAASGEPHEKLREYDDIFRGLGAAVRGVALEERLEADDALQEMEWATAVFITGGDQLRLTTRIAGTRLGKRMQERLYGDGLVVAGTSAGAAATTSVMVVGGRNHGTVRPGDVRLAPGLGLWRDAVVDTHFNQRGRISRLLTIFAHNPQVMGIGLDENTAVDLLPGERFNVLGEGAVTVVCGPSSHSSAPGAAPDETLAITDVTLHVLRDGYGFDLESGRPLLPSGDQIPTPGC